VAKRTGNEWAGRCGTQIHGTISITEKESHITPSRQLSWDAQHCPASVAVCSGDHQRWRLRFAGHPQAHHFLCLHSVCFIRFRVVGLLSTPIQGGPALSPWGSSSSSSSPSRWCRRQHWCIVALTPWTTPRPRASWNRRPSNSSFWTGGASSPPRTSWSATRAEREGSGAARALPRSPRGSCRWGNGLASPIRGLVRTFCSLVCSAHARAPFFLNDCLKFNAPAHPDECTGETAFDTLEQPSSAARKQWRARNPRYWSLADVGRCYRWPRISFVSLMFILWSHERGQNRSSCWPWKNRARGAGVCALHCKPVVVEEERLLSACAHLWMELCTTMEGLLVAALLLLPATWFSNPCSYSTFMAGDCGIHREKTCTFVSAFSCTCFSTALSNASLFDAGHPVELLTAAVPFFDGGTVGCLVGCLGSKPTPFVK